MARDVETGWITKSFNAEGAGSAETKPAFLMQKASQRRTQEQRHVTTNQTNHTNK